MSEKKYLLTQCEMQMLVNAGWSHGGIYDAFTKKELEAHEYHERTCRRVIDEEGAEPYCSNCGSADLLAFSSYCPDCGSKVVGQ